MRILVDADAFPRPAKDIVFRAARRLGPKVKWTLVANKKIYAPSELQMDMFVVEKTPDEADDRIVALIAKGDLVISSDIPLAGRVIEKGAFALSPKGQFYTEANIGARLATRNLLDQLRSEGEIRCGGAPYSPKDAQDFANRLDSFIARRLKEEELRTKPRSGLFHPPPKTESQ